MTLPNLRNAHPYHMHDAILGQPEAIARVISEERANANRISELVQASSRTHIVGIGTSWHAALVGEHVFRTEGAVDDVRAWNSFEFCERPPRLGADDTVIVLSHRGTKTYSARALGIARESGANTALLTGVGSDAQRHLADVVLETSTPDPSSAFTVSHTAAMTGLTMTALEISGRNSAEALADLPNLVWGAISTEDAVKRWAADSTNVERFYFAGTGGNTSTAFEAALKMKEANYSTTEGFQLEQYLHGPFVSTDEGCLVTFVAPPASPEDDRFSDVIKTVGEVGARTAAIVQAEDETRIGIVDTAIEMPVCPDFLSPIVYLVPLQLLTYWLAIERGHNPDTFRLDDEKFMAARQHYAL